MEANCKESGDGGSAGHPFHTSSVLARNRGDSNRTAAGKCKVNDSVVFPG